MPALLGKTSTLLLSLQLRDPHCSYPSNWGIPLQPWWAQPLFPEAPTRRLTGSLPSRAAEEAAAAAINRCRRRCTHQYRPNVLQMPLCARAAKRTALDGDVTRTCEADGCLVQARMQREQGLYLSAHISGADDVLVIRGLLSSKTHHGTINASTTRAGAHHVAGEKDTRVAGEKDTRTPLSATSSHQTFI